MYISSIVKGAQLVFLMTDFQIVNEHLLVYINGILTSGWIPVPFPKEDIDNILSSIANDAKVDGISDSYESRLNYFVSRVKRDLHVVFIHSVYKHEDFQVLLIALV